MTSDANFNQWRLLSQSLPSVGDHVLLFRAGKNNEEAHLVVALVREERGHLLLYVSNHGCWDIDNTYWTHWMPISFPATEMEATSPKERRGPFSS